MKRTLYVTASSLIVLSIMMSCAPKEERVDAEVTVTSDGTEDSNKDSTGKDLAKDSTPNDLAKDTAPTDEDSSTETAHLTPELQPMKNSQP